MYVWLDTVCDLLELYKGCIWKMAQEKKVVATTQSLYVCWACCLVLQLGSVTFNLGTSFTTRINYTCNVIVS
jgi:hypothetical protein